MTSHSDTQASPAQLYLESLTGWPSVLPEACMQREDWLAFIKLDLSTLPSYERHLAGKNLALAVLQYGFTLEHFTGFESMFLFAYHCLQFGSPVQLHKFSLLHGDSLQHLSQIYTTPDVNQVVGKIEYHHKFFCFTNSMLTY